MFGCELVNQIKDVFERVKKVLVDKGYEGQFFERVRRDLGIEAEVSSKPPSEKGFVPVKWCWVSERTFGWFIPKKQNLKELDENYLDEVVDNLNNRPRKTLGYLTPIEFFQCSVQKPRAVAFET